MSGKYYYLIASLPTLRIGGDTRFTKERFLYECQKWLSSDDMEAIHAADIKLGINEEEAGELLRKLIALDFDLRVKLAEVRKGRKKGETPRVPEELKPAMDAKDPLARETELARLRWGFLDSMQSEHFFDINWLVIYFLKVQIMERLDSFDKDKGEGIFYKLCEVKYEQKAG